MRIFLPIAIIGFGLLNCKSNLRRGPLPNSFENLKSIQGAWHLYDLESNTLVGKSPIFELAGQQKFIDTAEILCHMSKLQSGDLFDLIIRHSESNPTGQKLNNCPDYSYEGEIQSVQVFSTPKHSVAPIVIINLADTKKMIQTKNGQFGQLYYLYLENKEPFPKMGRVFVDPDETQKRRIPVVLIRSP